VQGLHGGFEFVLRQLAALLRSQRLGLSGSFAGAIQALVNTGMGRAGLHLHLSAIPVLGPHHGAGAQAQVVALPGTGELEGAVPSMASAPRRSWRVVFTG